MIRLIMDVPALEKFPLSDDGRSLKKWQSTPSGRIKALDKLLDLPHLNILLR
jgi:hypothetical protein